MIKRATKSYAKHVLRIRLDVSKAVKTWKGYIKDQVVILYEKIDEEAKPFLDIMVPVETTLTEREKTYTSALEKAKTIAAEKSANRKKALFGTGALFNGESYILGYLGISHKAMIDMDDSEFDLLVKRYQDEREILDNQHKQADLGKQEIPSENPATNGKPDKTPKVVVEKEALIKWKLKDSLQPEIKVTTFDELVKALKLLYKQNFTQILIEYHERE